MNQTEGSAIDYLTGRHNWTEKEDTHTQPTKFQRHLELLRHLRLKFCILSRKGGESPPRFT